MIGKDRGRSKKRNSTLRCKPGVKNLTVSVKIGLDQPAPDGKTCAQGVKAAQPLAPLIAPITAEPAEFASRDAELLFERVERVACFHHALANIFL